MFAVTKLDPRAGRVSAEQIYWGTGKTKRKERIELVDCKDLLPGGPSGTTQSNNLSLSIEKLAELGSDFLCPVGLETMSLKGYFGSEQFNYVKLKVEGCDLSEQECMTDEELIY